MAKKQIRKIDKKQQQNSNTIEPGMLAEATKGDLGEEDVSKPKVAAVVHDEQGNLEKVVVQKGVIFKKELDVPADRVRAVERNEEDTDADSGSNGKVVIDATETELGATKAAGIEQLANKATAQQKGLLDEVEEGIPTADGLRDMEAETQSGKQGKGTPGLLEQTEEALPTTQGLREMEQGEQDKLIEEEQALRGNRWAWLRQLGPGFLGGMAGNDASAVAAYSIDGAQNGFGHLWLLVLATPLYQSVMFASAKLGRITQKGLAEVLREHYSRPVALLAALVLVVANVALIAADLVAIGSGLELLTRINWVWFVLPVAGVLWYLTVYSTFDTIKKVFIVMSLAFVAYLITALLARPNWGTLLVSTFVPRIDFSFASISTAVALLGATLSPYTIFWQVQGEKEEKRPGTMQQKLRFAVLDIAAGVVSGNLIAYCIILSTASTLFVRHKSITTAADAALALKPMLGAFAEYIFAIGFIGAGLVAIPVLLASTSYAVAGSIGWPTGLSKKPWQNEGFYLILTLALIASLLMALLRIDPITLLFWANVLSGLLAPILVTYLFMIGNNRKIMQKQSFGLFTNIGLGLTIIVMTTAALLLFYGLLTGRR